MDQQRHRSRSGRSRLIRGKAGVWVALVALGAIVLGLAYAASRPKGTDSEQIQTALKESIQASKEGRPGGVLDKLSEAFSVNSQSVTSGQVAQAIKKFQPTVEVLQPVPTVGEDVAHILSPVKLTVSVLGSSHDFTVPDVDIEFHRETSRAWLIFPVSTWHISKIQVPAEAISNFQALGSLGGF